jgi:peptide/nickel transport system substrate-binding protein
MRSEFFRHALSAASICACVMLTDSAIAEPRHGIAMYGDPALPQDFVSLPYVNTSAPKGGAIIFGEPGGFDSLNPFIRKGTAPWGVNAHVYETLMGRSIDEPFTLYGLLAESVDVAPDRSWVEFTLREGARFSDGSPVTIADVMWSYETLGTFGHPKYHSAWQQVETMAQTGPRSLRFTFNSDNRELPLLMGMRPVLKKAQWEGRAFDESGFDVLPIGSSPYAIEAFTPGRSISFKRNPDYWGKDIPFMAGKANLDEIRYEFFGDGDVVFEAFKAGEINTYREGNAARWEAQYDFPAVNEGRIVKSTIPNQIPSGIKGFVMNTRRAAFADWHVRAAMLQAFNFEYISDTITGGALPRITSYFSNSPLGLKPGPASGKVAELLAPFAADLPPGTLEDITLPQSDGTARNRKNIARAMDLMEAAGYTIQNGVMSGKDGAPFTFEVLLKQGNNEAQNIIDIFSQGLNRIGISPKITVIDSAQYIERTRDYEFDMAYYTRTLSLSPGNEQRLYWGSKSADIPNTRNWMGLKSAAADAMIETMLATASQEEFTAATQALDRILTAGNYVIPIWYSTSATIAHTSDLHYPNRIPIYGATVGFQPDTWWFKSNN